MGCKRLVLTATAAVLVLVTVACEPAPTPWESELVSVNAAGTGPGNYPWGDGSSGSAVWSADGTAVAFSSSANDLAEDDTLNDAASDVYVRDLETGVTTRATQHPPSDFGCCTAVDALSADGTKVLFHSTRSDLTTNLPDSNVWPDYFISDLTTGTTSVVSVNAGGDATADGASPSSPYSRALMTPDASRVAFISSAGDLVDPVVTDTGPYLYVRDLAAGTTMHVASDVERLLGFSADGTAVLFSTVAQLVPEDGNDGIDGYDLYLSDITTDTITLVSTAVDGSAAGVAVNDANLAPDGKRVVFTSRSPDVAPGVDTDDVDDVFLRDLTAGTTTLISTAVTGTARQGLLSPDGSSVVYAMDGDLYIRDLATGTATLATPRTSGDTGSTSPVGFTGDSRVLVFRSQAGNLGPVDDNGTRDIYARDLASGVTHLVSAGSDGSALGDVGSEAGLPYTAVSPTGRRVLFLRREVYAATLPLADLAAEGTVEASGGSLVYRLAVSNDGPDGVEDVKLAFVLPEGTSYSTATTTTGACTEEPPRVVVCDVGDAGVGAVADVTVSATVQDADGAVGAAAVVRSATYEADPDNNVVTLTSSA